MAVIKLADCSIVNNSKTLTVNSDESLLNIYQGATVFISKEPFEIAAVDTTLRTLTLEDVWDEPDLLNTKTKITTVDASVYSTALTSKIEDVIHGADSVNQNAITQTETFNTTISDRLASLDTEYEQIASEKIADIDTYAKARGVKYSTLANALESDPDDTNVVIVGELGDAEFIVEPSSYNPEPWDIEFSNGKKGRLSVNPSRRLTLDLYRATFDIVTNDRDSLNYAIQSANGRVTIHKSIYVSVNSADDVINLPSNIEIEFLNGAAIYTDSFGFGLFAAFQQQNIKFIDAKIVFIGEQLKSLPTGIHSYAQSAANSVGIVSLFNARAMLSMMLFLRCSQVDLIRCRFESSDKSTNNRMLNRAITLIECNETTISSPRFSGVHWGITGWGLDGLYMTDVVSSEYGQLDKSPGEYEWDDAAHVVYITGQSYNSKNVSLLGAHDIGIAAIGAYYGLASTSYKFIGCDDLTIQNATSKRAHGCFDISTITGSIDVKWDPVNTEIEELSVDEGMNRLIVDAGVNIVRRLHANIVLNLANSFKNIALELSSGGTTAPLNDCHINATITYDGTGTTKPYVIMRGYDNDIGVNINAPNLNAGNHTIFRLDEGNYNAINATLRVPDSINPRFILNSTNKANFVGNSYKAHFVYQDKITQRSQQGTITTVNASHTFSLAGDSMTKTDFWPAGAEILSVISNTLTDIEGATGYTLGDNDDESRYGTRVGSGVNGGTDNADWLTQPSRILDAAKSLSIQPRLEGESFTSGQVKVSSTYRLIERSVDWY